MTTIAARVDDFGKPGWIALTVVGFIMWWPLGILVLGYLIGSGRMGCWTHHHGERWQRRMDRWQQHMNERMDRMRQPMPAGAPWYGPRMAEPSSGNRAFDEYRAETLRRLEDEQRSVRRIPRRDAAPARRRAARVPGFPRSAAPRQGQG